MSWQVEMAHEQSFVQLGKLEWIEMVEKGWTTKWLLRLTRQQFWLVKF